MNAAMLELEQQDIELQLQEVQLQRRLNEIEREKLEKVLSVSVEDDFPRGIVADATVVPSLYLHYCQSAMDNIPRIADVTVDGCVKIYGKMDCVMITHKYTMKSLLWIQSNLPKWSKLQRETSGFWKLLSEKYTSRFVKVSHSTMECLCYLVDSGKADIWFEKYNELKNNGQSTLEI